MGDSKLNKNDIIDNILNLPKNLTAEQIKKEIFSILSITEGGFDNFLNLIKFCYQKTNSFYEKQRLQIFLAQTSSYNIDDQRTNTEINRTSGKVGIVSLIREKDSSGKYKVYKYKVKNRGYPKHIINEYVKQKKGKTEGVKITDSKGREYHKDKKFSTGDTVYIKVPIESRETNNTMNHIEIQENYIKEQINGKINGINGAKITDSRGVEYLKNKKIPAGNNVYIKIPIGPNKFKKITYKLKDGGTPQDIINSYANKYEKQKKSYKDMLEKYNQQHPMGKNIKMSFGFPVRSYEDIENTLTGLTTKQIGIKPEEYEVIILLNRPNEESKFSNDTKEKILRFKKEHPTYNIHIFEKTFNFRKDKNGKTKVNFGEIYKTLGDTIVYRNLQRKNIKGMDPKKIENLIIKTGAADSTDKNPRYIANQLEKYSQLYGGKELIRLTGESRLPANICKTYPLIELAEFFQRYFDDEYVGGPINRTVGIGSYKSWIYCDAKGFNPTCIKGEDVDFVKRIRSRVTDNKNIKNVTMHYDEGFIGAIDESCDRGIWAMVEKNVPYCDRYNDNEGDSASKEKNRNSYAIKHKGEKNFKVLELTKENLEKNISALYTQKINNIFTGKMGSKKYRGRNDEKGNHHPGYLDSEEGKKATPQEKFERIAKNLGNPIVEKVLSRKDFMGLSKGDYSFGPIEIESYKDNKNKIKYRVKSYPIRFNNIAITKIQALHNQKIKNGYYNYR